MATDSAVTPLLPPPAAGAGGSALGVYIAVALTALSPVSFGYVRCPAAPPRALTLLTLRSAFACAPQVLGFSSPAAAPLLASGLLTARQLDIFEALSPLGAIAGAAVAGVGADYFGRTRALALSCAPFALGWALISAAEVRARATAHRGAAHPNETRADARRRARARSSSATCSPARASAACSTSCRCTSPKSRPQRALAPRSAGGE